MSGEEGGGAADFGEPPSVKRAAGGGPEDAVNNQREIEKAANRGGQRQLLSQVGCER